MHPRTSPSAPSLFEQRFDYPNAWIPRQSSKRLKIDVPGAEVHFAFARKSSEPRRSLAFRRARLRINRRKPRDRGIPIEDFDRFAFSDESEIAAEIVPKCAYVG